MLPDRENWFRSVFRKDQGRVVAAASERARSEIELTAPNMLAALLRAKKTRVEAVRHDDSSNGPATTEELSLLVLRQRPEPLYDVSFRENSASVPFWAYFAYVDGGFRHIGKLRRSSVPTQQPQSAAPSEPKPNQAAQSEPPPMPIHAFGNVQQAKLVCQTMPIYPQEAKAKGIQGNVVPRAIISKDGMFGHLEPISGPPILAESSVEAVKGWRYKPTLFNGDRMEVDTTITFVYTLGG